MLPTIRVVESIFVRQQADLGKEHCLPFRMLNPGKVVIPFEGSTHYAVTTTRIDRYPSLADSWWCAVAIAAHNRSSEKRTLGGRIFDYIEQLSMSFLLQIFVLFTWPQVTRWQLESYDFGPQSNTASIGALASSMDETPDYLLF